MMRIPYQLRRHEYGGVLIVGILTLIMLTAIGLAAITSSITENDIATNELRQKEAFYAAEIALEFAENFLRKNVTSPNDLDDLAFPGYYAKGKQPKWEDMKWDNTDSVAVPPLPAGYPAFAAPLRYTIEELGSYTITGLGAGSPPIAVDYFFRVAGQGTGRNSNAKAVVTTVYSQRFHY